jgi:2-desacetyl-2-hydroxyethyl bacteriochlorophyllide A dehydrogenase
MREFVAVPDHALIKSEGLSLDELALIEPLSIGAHAVKRAAVMKGEFVLIIGAGPIGLGIAQFAKIAGAHVIVVDVNEDRLQFCTTNVGIEHAINPLKQDVMVSLNQITSNNMPTVVIDATGNLDAINNAFQYLAHGGRYVLVGLQKGNISFNHPEFHKREATLMSSRNADVSDFMHVMDCIKQGLVKPINYITHRVAFDAVTNHFESCLDPNSKVVKAIVEF